MTDGPKLITATGRPIAATEHAGYSLEISELHVREIPLANLDKVRVAMRDNKLDEVVVRADDRVFLVYADEMDKSLQRGDRIRLKIGDRSLSGDVLATGYDFDTRAEKNLGKTLSEGVIVGLNVTAAALLGGGVGTLVGGPGLGALTAFFGGAGAVADGRKWAGKRAEARFQASALLDGLTKPVTEK